MSKQARGARDILWRVTTRMLEEVQGMKLSLHIPSTRSTIACASMRQHWNLAFQAEDPFNRLVLLGESLAITGVAFSHASDFYWESARDPPNRCGSLWGSVKPHLEEVQHSWCSLPSARAPGSSLDTARHVPGMRAGQIVVVCVCELP